MGTAPGNIFTQAAAESSRLMTEVEQLKAQIAQTEADHKIEIDALTVERDSFERAAALAARDVENLTIHSRRLQVERDDYFRKSESIKSGLRAAGNHILELVEQVERDAFGGDRRPTNIREHLRGGPQRPTVTERMPSVVTERETAAR